jgi:glutaredoxin-related protein
LSRFRAANTQVLGVSIDSVYSHAQWGRSLGGVSFPLLSDFEPKGGMAKAYGAYLDGPGITDRATVIIDSSGVVQFATAYGPPGRRDIGDLAAECEKINTASSGATADFAAGEPLGAGVLYVKGKCGPSRAAIVAHSNTHQSSIEVKNVTDDAAALAELTAAAGKDQAPCLIVDGNVLHESADIVQRFVSAGAPL